MGDNIGFRVYRKNRRRWQCCRWPYPPAAADSAIAIGEGRCPAEEKLVAEADSSAADQSQSTTEKLFSLPDQCQSMIDQISSLSDQISSLSDQISSLRDQISSLRD